MSDGASGVRGGCGLLRHHFTNHTIRMIGDDLDRQDAQREQSAHEREQNAAEADHHQHRQSDRREQQEDRCAHDAEHDQDRQPDHLQHARDRHEEEEERASMPPTVRPTAILRASALSTVHMSRSVSECSGLNAGTVTYDGAPEVGFAAPRPPGGPRWPRSPGRLPPYGSSTILVPRMPVVLRATGLLILSNVFMTFAWYAHLKNLSEQPVVRRRARRAGGSRCSSTCCRCRPTASATRSSTSAQLKILQEVITLGVFVPFAVFYMRQPLRLDFLWAALCLCGAVYFVFEERESGRDGWAAPATRDAVNDVPRPQRRRALPHATGGSGLGALACVRCSTVEIEGVSSPSATSCSRSSSDAAAASGLKRCRRSRT